MFLLGLVGNLLPAIATIVGKFAPDPLVRMKVESEILETVQTQILAQKSIILAEAQSESKFQSLWRPIVGWSFSMMAIFIIFMTSIARPMIHFFFGIDLPVMVVSPDLWNAVFFCLGGYMGLRSIEKVVRWLKF